jgi:hypothetical protein
MVILDELGKIEHTHYICEEDERKEKIFILPLMGQNESLYNH